MGFFSRKKQSEKLDESSLKFPRHLAIIMDGNGRWAEKRGLPRTFGHQKGANRVIDITKICADISEIEQLTLYAFSTENWKRPKKEVDFLMSLLKKFLVKERPTLIKNQVRFKTIGDVEAFPEDVREEIYKSIEVTKDFKRMTLTLALNYGSRQELLRATREIARKVRAGEIALEDIDESLFERYLYQPDMPSVDLLVRTSGELRISNYLLWQISYAELYITEKYWPNFDKAELFKAFEAYSKRDRRFGGLSSQSS